MLMSGWTGLDFSKYGPDEPILHSRQDAQTSALEAIDRLCGALPSARSVQARLSRHADIAKAMDHMLKPLGPGPIARLLPAFAPGRNRRVSPLWGQELSAIP